MKNLDFDIGNILYVVITLIAVLVGVLGKKKKPQRPGAKGTESEKRPGFFENMEEILRMNQENGVATGLKDYEVDLMPEEPGLEQVAAEESVKVSVPEPVTASSILDDYERLMKNIDDTDRDAIMAEGMSTTKSMDVIDLEQEAGTDYFEVINNFDAGTAVVYSAIINRIDY